MIQRLSGRIALITGASRGIGAAVAERFAREGAELILIARTVGGLEATDDAVRRAGGKAAIVPLDLREADKMAPLGLTLHERYGRLDILVGNAGHLGTLTPLTHADPKMFETVIATNLTANFRLLRAMHPLLAASDAGRAIFVSSGAAQSRKPYWGAYSASKAGLEAMVMTYAGEQAQGTICANIVDPGAVRTRMRHEAFPGEDASLLTAPENITDIFVELAEASCRQNGQLFQAQGKKRAA